MTERAAHLGSTGTVITPPPGEAGYRGDPEHTDRRAVLTLRRTELTLATELLLFCYITRITRITYKSHNASVNPVNFETGLTPYQTLLHEVPDGPAGPVGSAGSAGPAGPIP